MRSDILNNNYAIQFFFNHLNSNVKTQNNRHARAIKTGLPGFGLIYLRFIGTDINGVSRRLHKSWNPEKKSMASNRAKISRLDTIIVYFILRNKINALC